MCDNVPLLGLGIVCDPIRAMHSSLVIVSFPGRLAVLEQLHCLMIKTHIVNILVLAEDGLKSLLHSSHSGSLLH